MKTYIKPFSALTPRQLVGLLACAAWAVVIITFFKLGFVNPFSLGWSLLGITAVVSYITDVAVIVIALSLCFQLRHRYLSFGFVGITALMFVLTVLLNILPDTGPANSEGIEVGAIFGASFVFSRIALPIYMFLDFKKQLPL